MMLLSRSSPPMLSFLTTSIVSVLVILVLLESTHAWPQSNQQPGDCRDPCVPGTEAIMSIKAHGTSETPVQSPLRWGCDAEVADRICNFNRHYAEYSGYWETTSFLSELGDTKATTTPPKPISFYDSNTGKLLFTAPKNRSWQDFIDESRSHGWPSFRDDEVNWDTVRVLKNGETVSIDGTHLGHNLPDSAGRRYCINLVSIAGNPTTETEQTSRGRGRQRRSDL